MKTLMLFIALTASVWSSFSYSESLAVSISRFSPEGSTYNNCAQSNVCNQTFYMPVTATDNFRKTQYLFEIIDVTYSGQPCHFDGSSALFRCDVTSGRVYFAFQATNSPADPTQTCKGLEGGFIDGYINSSQPFCATVGSTGGTDPQPLNCIATCSYGTGNTGTCAGGPSGNLYYVTPESCPSPTDPIPPDDGTDPGEPCTENCEPTDPETPPGGDDGSGVPGTGDGPSSSNTSVTGTATDSEGKVTNINLEMDQDFSPITDRQNETNERLKVENQNSANLVEKVNGIGQGLIEANDNLEGIRDAIDGLGNPDMSGIEGKLDGIKESIDGIKDGMGTEDEGRHAGEIADLPDVEHAINSGYDTIITTMNSQANNELTNGLETIGDRFTAFESIPQIFAIASDSCAPLNFYGKSLDLCPYAATSSSVLTWVLTILTIIFIITSIVADIKRVRMT